MKRVGIKNQHQKSFMNWQGEPACIESDFIMYPVQFLSIAMKLTSSCLLLLCCLTIGNAAAAEDWLVIPTAQPNITFSIDRNSLERNGNIVKFREKLMYAKPEIRDEISGHLIAEKRMHRVMNCAEKTTGLIHGAMYNEKGRFITSTSIDEEKMVMAEIPPNTTASGEFSIVCGSAERPAGQGRLVIPPRP